MHEQFYKHFGLQHSPFQVTPNSTKFVSTPVHDRALSQLLFGIESHKGLVLLTGEPGTGKTTILHCALEVLQREGYSTAYVFHTLLSSVDVLRIILDDFGISCRSSEKSDLLSALRSWLIKRRQEQDCAVVVIDEAQALSDHTLDELRMLLDLEISGTNLLQIVLAGQLQLETKLRRDRLKQLRQRVMCQYRLVNLSLDDTVAYIRARLGSAGASNAEIFTPDSLKEIYQYSNGNPRMIHLLCEHSLLSVFGAGRQSVSEADILQVVREFELEQPIPDEVPSAKTSHADSVPVLVAIPKFPIESEISRDPSPPIPMSVAADATGPASREASETTSISTVADHSLSFREAVRLVVSKRFVVIDRRGKKMLSSFLEAGRSVLWLRREHKLKPILRSLPSQALVQRNFADPSRQGTEVSHSTAAKRQARRNGAGMVAPNQETPQPLRPIKPAVSHAEIGAVRVRHRNAKWGTLRYWRGIAGSLQRDVHQHFVQWYLERDRRESKRAPTHLPARAPTRWQGIIIKEE